MQKQFDELQVREEKAWRRERKRQITYFNDTVEALAETLVKSKVAVPKLR